MADITFNTDTLLIVTTDDGLPPTTIGFDSVFDEKVHPGTKLTVRGWKWDERVWPSDDEQNLEEFAATAWNPRTDSLGNKDYQSGIGDSTELAVLEVNEVAPSGDNTWTPSVEHGWYYDENVEGYLFSDDSVYEIVPSGTTSGVQTLSMAYLPKPGIPVVGTKWKWNAAQGRYDYFYRFDKVGEFTGAKQPDGSRLPTTTADDSVIFDNIATSGIRELYIDYATTDPPTLFLNSDYLEMHGLSEDPELIGQSSGVQHEEFNVLFSPIVSGETVSVYTSLTGSGDWTQWTDDFDVDSDLGTVFFSVDVPASGLFLGAVYYSSVAIEYERPNTRDFTLAHEIDINPVKRTKGDGFIYLSREELDPDSIELIVNPIPKISLNRWGPADIGNTVVPLKATVKAANGDVLEAQEVTFTQTNTIGNFSGGASEVNAFTNANGQARATLVTPDSIDDLGEVTIDVQLNIPESDRTTLTLSGVVMDEEDLDSIYVYKTFADDPTVGVNSPAQYYTDYFSDESFEGPTVSGDWENTRRVIEDLITPTEYNVVLRNGRKQLITKFNHDAIHPHDFTTGAFVPLRPESVTLTTSGTTEVVVSSVLDTISTTINSGISGYFVSGPTVATVQASVRNDRLGKTIFSDEIEILIKATSSQDGTALIEALNSAQKDNVFGSTTPPETGTIPLGFRIRSGGVTLASAIDGVTYIDINKDTPALPHTYTVIDRSRTYPSDIEGLGVWLSAGSLTSLADGAAVSSWTDSSSFSNSATQSTAANQPLYKTGIINSQPVVRFDGTDDFMEIAPNAAYSHPSTGYTFAMVYNSSDLANVVILDHGTTAYVIQPDDIPDRVFYSNGATVWSGGGSAMMDGSNHIVFVRHQFAPAFNESLGNKFIRLDGNAEAEALGTADPTFTDGEKLFIGALDGGAAAAAIDIAEIIIYNRYLDDTEMGIIESYLSDKYAIQLG